MKTALLLRTALAVPVLLSVLTMGQAAPKPTPPIIIYGPATNLPRVYRLPSVTSSLVPPSQKGPGDQIPPCFMVFGLRSGPHGAQFTDKYGAPLPLKADSKMNWTFTTKK